MRSFLFRLSTTTGAAIATLSLSVAGVAILPSAPASATTSTASPGLAAPNLSQAIAELQSPNHAHLAPLGTADSNNGFVCAAADIPLRSVANGEYVSAELAYSGDQYGMLRARTAAAPGPWEQFQ